MHPFRPVLVGADTAADLATLTAGIARHRAVVPVLVGPGVDGVAALRDEVRSCGGGPLVVRGSAAAAGLAIAVAEPGCVPGLVLSDAELCDPVLGDPLLGNPVLGDPVPGNPVLCVVGPRADVDDRVCALVARCRSAALAVLGADGDVDAAVLDFLALLERRGSSTPSGRGL